MGYYTRHSLEVSDGNCELIGDFLEDSEDAKWAIESNGDTYDECKWYDHEKDLRAFSKKHPDVLFTLRGEGEESGDIWTEYHKNGKVQVCKARIVFDDFDESKLN
jgi:hypothetical protein